VLHYLYYFLVIGYFLLRAQENRGSKDFFKIVQHQIDLHSGQIQIGTQLAFSVHGNKDIHVNVSILECKPAQVVDISNNLLTTNQKILLNCHFPSLLRYSLLAINY